MRTALLLSLAALTCTPGALAHGEAHDETNGEASYAEMHMAQEHHLDNFDLGAFFHLHDLNRDGILDVNELESVYGVHHEKVKKGSASVEVHTEKAKEIVQTVLAALDKNGDGVLTMREFIAGGVAGLPNFKGVEHLGHHYDAEGEYFLHHEEQFHNTPETQNDADYVHPEDIEHFMAHEQIEAEEEARAREFTGGESDGHNHATEQQIFKGEDDDDRVADQANASHEATPAEVARNERAAYARAQAAKFSKEAREANARGEWGAAGVGFKRPRDTADRLRKGVPYKYKAKKSWFGEF